MRGLILVAVLFGGAGAARSEEGLALAALAGAGSRGDQRLEVTARAQLGAGALMLGAETAQGPRSPERTGLVVGLDYSLEPLVLHGELRAVPPSAELARTAAQVGVRLEGGAGAVGLDLLGRSARLRDSALQSVGVQAEGEVAAGAAVRLGARGAVWASSLSGHALDAEPWSAFGDATLDWTERWETQAFARVTLGPFALTPQLALAQPAQQGQWAARGALQIEANLGPVCVSLEGSVAREWPRSLALSGLSLGLTWQLWQIGGER